METGIYSSVITALIVYICYIYLNIVFSDRSSSRVISQNRVAPADRLEQMLPPAGVGMNLEPIRLCAACYVESPSHRIEWQLKVTQGCQHHHLSLLSECPNCGARFKVPALWVDGWCQRCFMPFGDMVGFQKLY
ncbi:hypothetical protein [Nodularia sphaerocarpa]|uniref:hypothetical protein n=1 Tax=Nodularia sphaerocarpa TaxID=137816 RepID=UPI001EFB296D|nr:hypothetical protein [Nodularia sphaerocarpa]MDB9376442.1 hypothetical protein [Nodularia sphaerocarpa CS-585A2]